MKLTIPTEQNLGYAYIVQPIAQEASNARANDDVLAEAQGLARAISLRVVGTRICPYRRIHAGAYLGKGTRAEIAREIEACSPSITIVNCTLSPVQQRNLEKEWNTKVIDRTGLILEIFGARAQTKEGRLQVELAALDYQRSRLVRSWTHLERQRGGAGFMGGPGERQLELDKRIINNRILKLKAELEDVRRTRELGRKSRERVPFPIVSLVGYTNAGKSTLFNKITNADVFAQDLLFATLDPTLRKIKLPRRNVAILSDTVGFISDLPTHLVAAFRATLEQITHGDVIVHVIDVSRPDYQAQRQDVIKILEELGINYNQDPRIIEVYNKIDARPSDMPFYQGDLKNGLAISALTGEGIDELLEKVSALTAQGQKSYRFCVPVTDGKALAWLYQHGEVLKRKDTEIDVRVTVRLEEADSHRFIEKFSYKPLNQ